MSTGGGSGAEEAARINTELSKRYAAIGLPAVKGALGYATSALDQPIPGYAEAAYRMARTSALETGAARTGSARAALLSSLSKAGGGGGALTPLTRIESAGAQDLATEVGSIGASRAMAGVEERNKLLSILTGGGASATDLAAGFGNLNTRALGILGAEPGAYPYIVGGLSVGASAIEKYFQNRPPALAQIPQGSSLPAIG